MKFETNTKPADYQVSGQELRVNFDVIEAEREDLDGTKTKVYRGEQVVVHVMATASEITEAIVASKYSTGAEIALNRKPDSDPDKVAYLAFVETAKAKGKGKPGNNGKPKA
jgi:hypothetical protein